MISLFLQEILNGIRAQKETRNTATSLLEQIQQKEDARLLLKSPKVTALAVVYLAVRKHEDIENRAGRKKYYNRIPWSMHSLAKSAGSSGLSVSRAVKLINQITTNSS